MPNVDIPALKALAEAAVPTWDAMMEALTEAIDWTNTIASARWLSRLAAALDKEHLAAANPTTVLALIARIEELEKEARNHMIAWTAGLDD